jgi:tetratricopeptide (TPR) repeat protein
MHISEYYRFGKQDLSSAMKYCQIAISLAISNGNTKQHAHGLQHIAFLNWMHGDYSASKMHAQESQRLARTSGDFYREAHVLDIEGICLQKLGDYRQSGSVYNKARDLLHLCGASGGQLDRDIMNQQAEVHRSKSEYVEARSIHGDLLPQVTKDQNPYSHASASLNIAEIDVAIATPKQNIQGNIETARKKFNTMGLAMEITMCETILADLYFREHDTGSLFKNCIKSSMAQPNITTLCLDRLADVTRWNVSPCPSSWTTVYFMHSHKFKEKLGIYKGLQFLGDIFLASGDEATAISLYTAALQGFTQMNVHRSRAECMLRLGDISNCCGDLLKALELWETARPLFERSSQAKLVEHIDRRLASVGEDVLQPQRQNLSHIAEINAPSRSGTVEEFEDEESHIKDREVDLNKAQTSI